jgi:serine O-acetyltransferase
MERKIENEIGDIVGEILEDYRKGRAIDKRDIFNQPDKDEVIRIVQELLGIIYPGYYRDNTYKIYNADNNLSVIIEDVIYNLNKQIAIALKYSHSYQDAETEVVKQAAQKISLTFIKQIPKIREYVDTDLQAAFDGDPATDYKDEIIFSYPGLFAITVNRIAHVLYELDVPLIPRIMTEYAHSATGIDIHPGATIGKYFFIDHGTGIVIGESTIIGENVKIYQGVTLGALSTRLGQKLKNLKRHPTIEDNVTIYSGASILGGETVIGKNSVIGSNAFITKSVGEGTRVSIRNQELQFKYGKKEPAYNSELEQDEFWYYSI